MQKYGVKCLAMPEQQLSKKPLHTYMHGMMATAVGGWVGGCLDSVGGWVGWCVHKPGALPERYLGHLGLGTFP